MSNNWFQFKQFRVDQDKTAMKVGTDGVLLGVWADHQNPIQILDIGTGTGLVALMLAQRFSNAQIDAVEIEKEASEQAQENFSNSPWHNRLKCFHTEIQTFKPEIEKKYQLIVSNPPYFLPNFHASDLKRKIARQSTHLNATELIRNSKKWIANDGVFSVILPLDASEEFIKIAISEGLYCMAQTHVRPTRNHPIKRSLLAFSLDDQLCKQNELVIETEKRHHYTTEFKKLVEPFYLNPQ